MRNFNRGFLVVFLVILHVIECQRWNPHNGKVGSPRKSSKAANYYSEEIAGGRLTEVNSLPAKSQPPKSVSRSGIGAWGYISIILFVILSGMSIYYTILFYPIVCKKQRMYHVMGSTTV